MVHWLIKMGTKSEVGNWEGETVYRMIKIVTTGEVDNLKEGDDPLACQNFHHTKGGSLERGRSSTDWSNSRVKVRWQTDEGRVLTGR